MWWSSETPSSRERELQPAGKPATRDAADRDRQKMLTTPLLLLAAPPPPSLPPFECGPIFASRNNTRVDLPKGHHSAPNNERPWCYNLNVNKLAEDGLGLADLLDEASQAARELSDTVDWDEQEVVEDV